MKKIMETTLKPVLWLVCGISTPSEIEYPRQSLFFPLKICNILQQVEMWVFCYNPVRNVYMSIYPEN